MPDLDRIERKLPPEWRPAYKLVKGGQPMEEIVRILPKCVAAILRRRGGAPGLGEFARAVERHDAGLLNDRSLASIVQRLEHGMEALSGSLMARAALRPNVSGPVGMLHGPVDVRLAEEYLVGLIEHDLFSQMRDYLVGKRFSSRDEALAFETQLLREVAPALRSLARKLAREPSSKQLRAPRSRIRRKSTRELLDQLI